MGRFINKGFIKAQKPNERFSGILLYIPRGLCDLLDLKGGEIFAYDYRFENGKLVVTLTKVKDPNKVIKIEG